MSEEAIVHRFGPETRTVADIVFEVNLVNEHVGIVMKGEKPFDWPSGGYIVAPTGFDSKEIVLEAFRSGTQRLMAIAESFSEAEFQEPLQTEEGVTTRYERCQFMALHIWYHSGQLNYIQTLLGDSEWHWN